MATLLIECSNQSHRAFRLGTRTIVIGRQEGLPLQLDDDQHSISRRHVQIHFDPCRQCYLALDLKSANGVYVNGNRIANELQLADGDVIRIGHRIIHFIGRDLPSAVGVEMDRQIVGERERSTIIRLTRAA